MIEYFSPSSHTLTTSPAPRGDTDEEEAFITNIYSNDFLFCFLHFTWETWKLKKAHKCHVTYFLCLLFLLNNTRKVYALLFHFVKNAFCALKHCNDDSQRFFCHQTWRCSYSPVLRSGKSIFSCFLKHFGEFGDNKDPSLVKLLGRDILQHLFSSLLHFFRWYFLLQNCRQAVINWRSGSLSYLFSKYFLHTLRWCSIAGDPHMTVICNCWTQLHISQTDNISSLDTGHLLCPHHSQHEQIIDLTFTFSLLTTTVSAVQYLTFSINLSIVLCWNMFVHHCVVSLDSGGELNMILNTLHMLSTTQWPLESLHCETWCGKSKIHVLFRE